MRGRNGCRGAYKRAPGAQTGAPRSNTSEAARGMMRDCYASCMAWVVTLHATLKGTRPQPKLATHCTKPIHEAVGNGFPKKAPRVRLRRYSTCSHENLFLGKKIQKKLTAAERSKVHAPSRCWGPMAPAEASRRSLAGGLWVPHRYGY